MESFLERLAPIWVPHPGQREFLLSPARIRVLACGRRWGKTDACAVQTLEAVTRRGPPTRHLFVAPTLDQARLLFDRLVDLVHRAADLWGWVLAKGDLAIRSTPYPRLAFGGHVVAARTGHTPRLLRGQEATDIVVDEAAFVPDALVRDVLWPMLATTDGSMTLISTPNGRNGFWDLFQAGVAGRHGVWSRRASSAENPLVRPEFLAVQRELLTEDAFAVEYEAEFLDASGAVFGAEAIRGCLVPGFPEPLRGPFFIGVDLARRRDHSAFVVLSGTRQAACLARVERFRDPEWATQVDRIEALARLYPGASLVVDSTGPGDGIFDLIRERLAARHRVARFDFTLRSKAELIGRLQLLVQRQALRMTPDPVLLDEMERFACEPSELGPPRYRARSGHDDAVIALALAAWNLPAEAAPAILVGPDRRFLP